MLFLGRLETEKGFDLIFDFINQYPNKGTNLTKGSKIFLLTNTLEYAIEMKMVMIYLIHVISIEERQQMSLILSVLKTIVEVT